MASTNTAVSLGDEKKAIDDAVTALAHLTCGTNVKHRDITFADVERYVAIEKTITLLRYHKSCIEGKPKITHNIQLNGLFQCVDSNIRAEQIERQQRCQPELTVDDERQIIRSVFETEHLITLLGALFRFERHDLVTELIEKARIIGGNDFARVDELKRLCVDKLFGMVVK